MTSNQSQKRTMAQAQIMDLFANLDRELLLLMGGFTPGDELNAAAATAGAEAMAASTRPQDTGGNQGSGIFQLLRPHAGPNAEVRGD